ncbi:MAG: pyridoxal phosphate-dependent aminotransferase [Bdellovibrionales bacterium]|nr:pyridoxal phosphate-dependent aminotransferase [Bdellovibrionales bacterium]
MLSKRVENLKSSPTLALAAKAKELKNQGLDVYSLTVGEPDWDTFDLIKKAGIEAIQAGQTKYSPAEGTPELRAAICQQTVLDLGVHYDPKQVTVTAGAKFVIYSALQCLINPGDEVVIPSPYWVSYPTMVELAGGLPVIAKCGAKEGFKLTPEILARSLSSRTKMLILNSPSNPTGAIYTRDELQAIAEVLREHREVVVLSDDIYNRLIFTGESVAPHLLHVAPDLADRTLVVNGVSKTYAMTGWRLGWALGPHEIIKAMTNLQSQSVSCASPFTQVAALEALRSGSESLKPFLKKLHARRDFVFERLSKMKDIVVEKPQGAFYIWPDFGKICGKAFKGKCLAGCSDIAKVLLEEELVAVVPGVEFGAPGFLRLSFALNEDRLGKALMRIESFLDRLE